MLRRVFRGIHLLIVLGIGFVVSLLLLTIYQNPWPEFNVTENEIREAIISGLKEEEQSSFLVTGALELNVDITAEDTKYLFPEYFDDMISLGTTRSNVRLPGRVTYGIDLDQLSEEFISMHSDSIVVITVSAVEIQAVEVDFENMQIRTEVGWARLHSKSGKSVEKRALILAKDALRQRAAFHLQSSPQPLVNTEKTLSQLLTPVLRELDIDNPIIKCQIAPALVEPMN